MWKTQEKHPSLTARGIREDSPGKLILGLNLKDERVGLNTDAKSLKAKGVHCFWESSSLACLKLEPAPLRRGALRKVGAVHEELWKQDWRLRLAGLPMHWPTEQLLSRLNSQYQQLFLKVRDRDNSGSSTFPVYCILFQTFALFTVLWQDQLLLKLNICVISYR